MSSKPGHCLTQQENMERCTCCSKGKPLKGSMAVISGQLQVQTRDQAQAGTLLLGLAVPTSIARRQPGTRGRHRIPPAKPLGTFSKHVALHHPDAEPLQTVPHVLTPTITRLWPSLLLRNSKCLAVMTPNANYLFSNCLRSKSHQTLETS